MQLDRWREHVSHARAHKGEFSERARHEATDPATCLRAEAGARLYELGLAQMVARLGMGYLSLYELPMTVLRPYIHVGAIERQFMSDVRLGRPTQVKNAILKVEKAIQQAKWAVGKRGRREESHA